MATSDLLVEKHDGVLHITVDRQAKRNALSRAVLHQLRETFLAAADDEDLLVAVLRGAGDKSFAAGGDLRDLNTVRTVDDARELADQGKAALDTIRRFPVPVVALVNGDALGGGAELSVACDLRVFATHARIGFIQGKLNISTAWGGGIDLLQLVGPATGLRLLSRSELVDAPTALAIGLADAVAKEGQTIEDAMHSFLEPLRRQAPQALRAFKALASQTRFGRSRDDLAALETRLFSGVWIHDDHWAAVKSILQ